MTSQLPAWIVATQWASRLVLLVLAALSFWSVAIMVDRFRALTALERASSVDDARRLIAARDWSALRQWVTRPGLHAGTLRAALEAEGASKIDRAVRSYLSSEKSSLERGLTTLATLGSNAPFIGLFGTVLGIIQAFGALSSSSGAAQSSTASVMAGISEALVATAVGLFVAIPAVVAYNVFSRKLRVLLVDCESLRDLYLSRMDS